MNLYKIIVAELLVYCIDAMKSGNIAVNSRCFIQKDIKDFYRKAL
ncbi:hypothetical protein AB2T57_09900 [Clostridium butyricum]